jgi:ABC-2 type transport system ATP-binding protein
MNLEIADTRSEPTVRLANVSKRFRHTRALGEVSLEAGTGILGLLGPNGAGKTTLLRILATVLAPDAGDVRLLGRDPSRSHDRLEIRRRLGYMPQEPGFHRNFTAFEFVDYVAILKEMTNRRRRHREVGRAMELAGLSAVTRKKIRALSGGMRRRVALAQSLLGDPDLLILDEPTAGLDPEQRLRFRDMVSRLGEDRTIIVSTHQTEDVAALCQQVVVMNRGTILLRGTPHDVTEVARGHVWLTEGRDPSARLAWRTAEGRHRNIGDAPAGAELVDPTIEDGYLLLVGEQAFSEAA